jgi:hypothetical protein
MAHGSVSRLQAIQKLIKNKKENKNKEMKALVSN